MPFYRFTKPAWIFGTFYQASNETPVVLECPKEYSSKKWAEVEGPANVHQPLYAPWNEPRTSMLPQEAAEPKPLAGTMAEFAERGAMKNRPKTGILAPPETK